MRFSPFRSAALVALIPTVFAVIGVIVMHQQLRERLYEAAQTRLLAEIQGFEALYDQRRIVALREAIEYRSVRGDPAGSIYILMDRNGTVLAGNLDAWPAQLEVPHEMVMQPFQSFSLESGSYMVSARVLRGGFPILVGTSLRPLKDTLTQMLWVFAGFGVIMLGAGLGAATLVAGRARRRMATLNTQLDRIGGAGGLATRLQGADDAGPEYAQLSSHINDMLDRIAHLFDAHQRLGNAVAHEMRTPLARIRTQLDGLDLDAGARAGLEGEIRTTIRLFDSLLSIAQMDAEAGNTVGLVSIDLAQIAFGLSEFYGAVAEEKGRKITTDLEEGATILGDAQLFSQLLSNLIENGLKYTNKGDEITIRVWRSGSRVRLRVQDDGPGIAPGQRAQLFTAFARGKDTEDKPGHGLGLSLVRAIALRHGAVPSILPLEKGFAIEINCLHFSGH